MNAMKNKIQSQKGASITFALLIFLVCSVVSIVVVVAGSAAAGRMSERAETDQRYYAVTSAVELLCDDFKDMKVTMVAPAGEVTETSVDVTEILDKDGNNKDAANCALLADVSKRLVSKISKPDTEKSDTLTLAVTTPPTGYALDCTIKEVVSRDGRVIFEVSNKKDEEAEKQSIYTLQAIFDANITQSTSQYKKDDGNIEDRITTTLNWSVNSIKKGTMPVS